MIYYLLFLPSPKPPLFLELPPNNPPLFVELVDFLEVPPNNPLLFVELVELLELVPNILLDFLLVTLPPTELFLVVPPNMLLFLPTLDPPKEVLFFKPPKTPPDFDELFILLKILARVLVAVGRLLVIPLNRLVEINDFFPVEDVADVLGRETATLGLGNTFFPEDDVPDASFEGEQAAATANKPANATNFLLPETGFTSFPPSELFPELDEVGLSLCLLDFTTFS
jgi:hypothetical protein